MAHAVIREAMGKGNGVDESHCMKKGPVRRLAPRLTIVNQRFPCPLKSLRP